MYIYIYTYIHTDVMTYVHMYMHTYIHMYIHTYPGGAVGFDASRGELFESDSTSESTLDLP